MRLTPQDVLEHALDASILTEDEREKLRETMASALTLMSLEVDWIGGTDAEDDPPRATGCGPYRRPEGLSAGARYLRGEA